MSVPSETAPAPGHPPLRLALRVIGLVALVGAVEPGTHSGLHGVHLIHLLLFLTAAAGYAAWVVAGERRSRWMTLVALLVLAAAGGILSPSASASISFAAVVGVGAALAFDLPPALAVTAVMPAAHLLTALVDGHSLTPVLGSIAAALGGLMIGVSRRQTQTKIQQAAQMQVERERGALEHVRAELLAERNRLAREIHDVLAHTLGAVSVQIEALDTKVDTESPAALRAGLQQTRRLVTEGLEEARRAVAAFRDDAPPLPEQLKELSQQAGAILAVTGDPRPLTPHVSLALYRIAQESLTNATKHAAGATTRIELAFTPGAVRLDVANGSSADGAGSGSSNGGGYGLQGMRERVLLLGGEVEAGPAESGWLVTAKLPA